MTVKLLHTKAEYKAALKTVSALVDADPHSGTSDAEQLESLGALIEAYESKEKALMMLDYESHVTLSQRDFAAFSKACNGDFEPNPKLENALLAARTLIGRAG